MLKFGLEREFFVKDLDNNYVLCPQAVPHDDCGYLAEARTEPTIDPYDAVYLLHATIARIKEQIRNFGCALDLDTDTTRIDQKLRRKGTERTGHKTIHKAQNLYDKAQSEASLRLSYAGLHIHFSDGLVATHTGTGGTTYKTTSYSQLDIPSIVRFLDQEFANDIREAKRLPGFYELKTYGFEYRSLPMSVGSVESLTGQPPLVKALKHIKEHIVKA